MAEGAGSGHRDDGRDLVSAVVPAYQEARLATAHLEAIWAALSDLEFAGRQLVAVDDGSTDGTGAILDAFAAAHDGVTVVHHAGNCGLGQALRSGFARCRGRVVVSLDIDLSYGTALIRGLVEPVWCGRAALALASPYMPGGSTHGVPWLRELPSRWLNGLLARSTPLAVHTFTSMVRAYDRQLLRRLALTSTGTEINLEILWEAVRLGAAVTEVPARLDWTARRRSRSRGPGLGSLARRTLPTLAASLRLLHSTHTPLRGAPL